MTRRAEHGHDESVGVHLVEDMHVVHVLDDPVAAWARHMTQRFGG